MSTFRDNHKEKGNFTQISNTLILDTRVSEKAKMQLIVMLSRPDAWRFNMEGLLAFLHGGLSALQSGLKELVKFGYLKRVRKHINGRFDWEYTVIENPTGEQDNKSENTKEEQKTQKDIKPENTETPAKSKKKKNYSKKNNKQKNYSLKTGSYSNTGSSNTENNNTVIKKSEKTACTEKQTFGKYKNVPLTPEEYDKLVETYGKDQTDKSIDGMSEYMHIHNKSYPNVYARLDLWIREDIEKLKQNQEKQRKQERNRYKIHYDDDFDANKYTQFVNDYKCI
ncbi:MAG: hypothetical protein K2J39_00860 [Ruminococcus sp.]|nr:hypothetical protein [Ruminococcus sp.]